MKAPKAAGREAEARHRARSRKQVHVPSALTKAMCKEQLAGSCFPGPSEAPVFSMEQKVRYPIAHVEPGTRMGK